MKLKVKIKRINGARWIPEVRAQGDWIDLHVQKDYHGQRGDLFLLPLGIAMKLPKGFEAEVAPRSSTPDKYGFIMPNSIGIIDNSYSGDQDEWKCPALFFKEGIIQEGSRICQFRITLSQKASLWTKLLWLFCSSVKLVEVDHLDEHNRGGFGSTGQR